MLGVLEGRRENPRAYASYTLYLRSPRVPAWRPAGRPATL